MLGKDKCKEYYREEDVPHSLVYDDKSIKSWSSLELCLYHAEHGSGACIYPYMLRMLGQSEYGLYSLAASIIAYLTVLDLGFGNAIVRYTAKFEAEGKKREQQEMFGMFFLLYIGIG